MIRQYELVERVRAYDPEADEDALNRAYVYAMKMHGSQVRASGDPYFSHPLEVAGILTGMKLDSASIVTALLHDVVEDTPARLDDIKKMFGAEIAQLVDGVTKLARIKMPGEDATKAASATQAENFGKLILAMSEDLRVLLVKLADRLHNMRTLGFCALEKRKRIAKETLELYAPLAERIGIHQIKDELEDLAFRELHGDAHQSITTRLDYLRREGGDMAGRIILQLYKLLRASGLDPKITGREKAAYSIWRKMQHKNIGFEQLSDIMAFRVVVGTVGECYQALGEIHSNFHLVPGRFKDYISTPKPNGYKSLHTTIIGPERQRIEIQIRTADMHETAELGVAAHWSYKQGKVLKAGNEQQKWLNELREIFEHAQKPEEFLEHTKMELFQDQVFCFTPKGDIFSLPRGATPVDFAYAVHSDIGDHCVGAKVNGRIVPLNSELHNGDQIEISTSKAQTPSPAWERFVITGRAKARIRRFIRNKQREEFSGLGRAMLQKVFKQEGYEFTDKAVQGVLKTFRGEAVEDLYAEIGGGHQSAREVFNVIFPGHKAVEKPAIGDGKVVSLRSRARAKTKGTALPIKGLIPGIAIHYAGCCHPLRGDRIVGIVTTGKGVTIHTIDCESLESYGNMPERWLDVAWNEEEVDAHDDRVGRLHVTFSNEQGGLATLTTVIARNNGNIINLLVKNRTVDFWEILIDVEVRDVKQLTNIIAALRATPEVVQVERARS